jgi:hypothetical protein
VPLCRYHDCPSKLSPDGRSGLFCANGALSRRREKGSARFLTTNGCCSLSRHTCRDLYVGGRIGKDVGDLRHRIADGALGTTGFEHLVHLRHVPAASAQEIPWTYFPIQAWAYLILFALSLDSAPVGGVYMMGTTFYGEPILYRLSHWVCGKHANWVQQPIFSSDMALKK